MWAELLKKGSLVAIIGALVVYGSGWQYYHNMFVALNAPLYFLIPWELGLGEGFPGFITVLVLSALSILIGYGAKLSRDKSRLGKSVHVLLVIPILFGYFLPLLGEILRVPAIGGIAQADWRFTLLKVTTPVFMYLMGFSWPPRPNEPSHHLYYSWGLIIFGALTFYYSALLGTASAYRIYPKATILFTDAELQREYANVSFVPIMEKGDDIIVARSVNQQPGVKLMLIKKSLVRTINF